MPSYRSATSGKTYALGPELARGGEGAIHPVDGQNGLAAKVYLKSLDPSKAEKIKVMAAISSPELLKIAAWPQDVLLGRDGRPAGFIMPRIGSSNDAHELYSPRSRASSFPEADFRFLVHVATNVARAFATIHSAGHVIGDVNHGHMLVGGDGRVVLIDADSFQVNVAGKLYTCDVGVPLFTAPELHGKSFRGLQRTADHDCFGLAVMIFHLLGMGRHPFAGVWGGSGDMPIERAIAERRYAYGSGASQRQMRPPPGTVSISSFGSTIEGFFERAFTQSGTRPTARAWIDALENLKLSLVKCGSIEAHYYPRHAGACPWCALEKATGVRLFGAKLAKLSPTGAPIDIGALWSQIERAVPPPPDPPLPSEGRWVVPDGVKLPSMLPKRFRQGSSLAVVAGTLTACNVGPSSDLPTIAFLCLYGLAFLLWPRPDKDKLAAATATLKSKQAQFDLLMGRWKSEASSAAFTLLKQELQKAHLELQGIPAERAKRLDKRKRCPGPVLPTAM